MMGTPLLIVSLIQHAARNHADTEIVSRSIEGPIHRYSYAESYRRIAKLAHALRRLGISTGDRVATLAWNGYRHFELYYAIAGIGAICHTINPRLFPEQLKYIVNHAEDKAIFLDSTFVPLMESLAPDCRSVADWVVMTNADSMPECAAPTPLCYESLIAGEADSFDWPAFDENTASSLCYTSGTTGEPKGALYTHRSTVLHSFSVCSGEAFRLSSQDSVLPIVPMFHVNGWGIPYACPMVGAKLVLPGADYSPAAVFDLLDGEMVTFTAGVPTVWFMLLEHLQKEGLALPHLKTLGVGGSAAPRAMIRTFQETYGVEVCHAWGMTETSPVGTTGFLRPDALALGTEARLDRKVKQGRTLYGMEMKIVDDDGKELPRDGRAFGELMVRGPWVIDGYYKNDAASEAAFDDEGWFRTGDIARLDNEGYMQIVDRSKDVIKSGGEWISTIDLENAAVSHPDVTEAAVIGLPHPKWDERPLLVIVAASGSVPDKDSIMRHLASRVAKWWLPDDIAFVEELPHTATGKISKRQLREAFKDYRLPVANGTVPPSA